MKKNSFAGTGKSHVHVALMATVGVIGSVWLSACTKERFSGAGGLTGGESTFNVSLQAGRFVGASSAGGALEERNHDPSSLSSPTSTRVIPATGMHEDRMENIWVVQFDASGGCVRSTYYASYDPANFPVTLSNGTNQTVAFVANTFDADLFAGCTESWERFRALTRTVSEATIHTGTGAGDRYLPISGIYRGDITAAGLPAAVQMKRAVAKVRVTWSVDLATAGDRFVPTGLRLCQAATTQSYLEPGASFSGGGGGVAAELYPTAAAGNFAPYDVMDNPGAAGSATWYVAENLRGTGSGTTAFDKNEATAAVGQGAFCTYVDLQGTYTFAGGETVELSYKFYLGGDVTADYNVRRNNFYDLTVRIVGANAADTRISVTSADGTWGVEVEGTGSTTGDVKFD